MHLYSGAVSLFRQGTAVSFAYSFEIRVPPTVARWHREKYKGDYVAVTISCQLCSIINDRFDVLCNGAHLVLYATNSPLGISCFELNKIVSSVQGYDNIGSHSIAVRRLDRGDSSP